MLHNDATFTSLYKGEKLENRLYFFLSHAFDLKLSGKFTNTARNCVEMFRAYTHVFRAYRLQNRSHNDVAFTTLYKIEKWKTYCSFFLNHAFGLKLSETVLKTIRNDVENRCVYIPVFIPIASKTCPITMSRSLLFIRKDEK